MAKAEEKSKGLSVLETVRKILQETNLGTQEELRGELARRGHVVTQSTISRALKKLGAIRTYNENEEAFYSLPPEDALPPVNSTLTDLVLDVVSNETLVVVRCKPGAASLIARHIDFNVKSAIGTIAGDDCTAVIPASIKKIRETEGEIRRVLGIQS